MVVRFDANSRQAGVMHENIFEPLVMLSERQGGKRGASLRRGILGRKEKKITREREFQSLEIGIYPVP